MRPINIVEHNYFVKKNIMKLWTLVSVTWMYHIGVNVKYMMYINLYNEYYYLFWLHYN